MASSLVSSCDDRTKEAFQFILNQSIPGHGDIFEEVSDKNLQPGDIVLFPKDSSHGTMSLVFKHAAVFCGDGEIIHLQYSVRNGSTISKESYSSLKRKRGKCRIYRKKGGVNLDNFYGNVRKAMNSIPTYGLFRNNCVHFALYLLDLVEFNMQLVSTVSE